MKVKLWATSVDNMTHYLAKKNGQRMWAIDDGRPSRPPTEAIALSEVPSIINRIWLEDNDIRSVRIEVQR